MAVERYLNTEEWNFDCEDSIRLEYLLPWSEAKIRPNPTFLGVWNPEDLRYSEIQHSKDLSQMVRRRRGRGGRAQTNPQFEATPSQEGSDKTASSPAVGLSPPESAEPRIVDPTQGTYAGQSSTSQVVFESNHQYPIISLSLDGQPPAEIRTNCRLPPITASLRRLEFQPRDSMTLDVNSLWGQASLVSADGRVAMAQFRADILTGGSLVAPLLQSPLVIGGDDLWSLRFQGLVICEPGYFRIRIALMRTSQNDGQRHGSPVIDAPTEQLSIGTSLIRVHAFASM